MHVQHSYNSSTNEMVEFYLLTFPRFPLRKKEHKSYFGQNRTHGFRTSRCAGYLLLDHSGDNYFLIMGFLPLSATASDYTVNRHRVSPELIRSRSCVPMASLPAESPPAQGHQSLNCSSSDGCSFFRCHHGPNFMRLSFPTPTIQYYYWYNSRHVM